MRGYPGRSNTLDEDFRADMDNAVSIERPLRKGIVRERLRVEASLYLV